MKRLLLVEDEDVILKALKRLLERNHYEVECAASVNEALARELSSFDLILADLRLPGELGTALIPASDPVPVVIMTSHASVRSAVEARRIPRTVHPMRTCRRSRSPKVLAHPALTPP